MSILSDDRLALLHPILHESGQVGKAGEELGIGNCKFEICNSSGELTTEERRKQQIQHLTAKNTKDTKDTKKNKKSIDNKESLYS
jgi:hypothetical protein